MSAAPRSPRITVSGDTAKWITYIVGFVVLIVICSWLYINAATSVQGITIALGTAAWIKVIGLAFPASDVLAISVDMIGRFVYDENDEPVISHDTVRLVWGLWAVAAFLDIALTFYVFDKLNYEQFVSGELYSAGLITEANRRIIPAVLALATYALTVLIVHGSRGVIKSVVERYATGRGGGGGFGRRSHRPAPRPAVSRPTPPRTEQSSFIVKPDPRGPLEIAEAISPFKAKPAADLTWPPKDV